MSPEPARRTVVRHAARVILLDEQDRVLLFMARVPQPNGSVREVWITPGGGVDQGESDREAAARELWEETGLRAELSHCVWVRSHTFAWQGDLLEQRERYFVARTAMGTVDTRNHTELEREFLGTHRWWTAAEIAESRGYFAPRAIALHLPRLLAGDYPAEPIDVGV